MLIAWLQFTYVPACWRPSIRWSSQFEFVGEKWSRVFAVVIEQLGIVSVYFLNARNHSVEEYQEVADRVSEMMRFLRRRKRVKEITMGCDANVVVMKNSAGTIGPDTLQAGTLCCERRRFVQNLLRKLKLFASNTSIDG